MAVIVLVFVIWCIAWLIECYVYVNNLIECMDCRKTYGCPYSFVECLSNPMQVHKSVFVCDDCTACRKHRLNEKDRKELLEQIKQLE